MKKSSQAAKKKNGNKKRSAKGLAVWIAPNLERITKGEAGRRGLTDLTTGYYLGLADLALKGEGSPLDSTKPAYGPPGPVVVEPVLPQAAYSVEDIQFQIEAKAPAKPRKPSKLALPKPPKLKLRKPPTAPAKPKLPQRALPKLPVQPKPPRRTPPRPLGRPQQPRPPKLSVPKPPRRRG